MNKTKAPHNAGLFFDALDCDKRGLRTGVRRIEAAAKRRLADEDDAAQERGEVAGQDGRRSSKAEHLKPAAKAIGLTRKQIHEARTVRDAERREPGIVRRTLDKQLAERKEPSHRATGVCAQALTNQLC